MPCRCGQVGACTWSCEGNNTAHEAPSDAGKHIVPESIFRLNNDAKNHDDYHNNTDNTS